LARELPLRGAPGPLSSEVRGLLEWYDAAFYSLSAVTSPQAQRVLNSVDHLQESLGALRGSPGEASRSIGSSSGSRSLPPFRSAVRAPSAPCPPWRTAIPAGFERCFSTSARVDATSAPGTRRCRVSHPRLGRWCWQHPVLVRSPFRSVRACSASASV